jgi:hypothetical protein
MENEYKFCEDGKVRYDGVGGSYDDPILTIWIENGVVCIDNQTLCDYINIPASVISKLILESDKNKIRSELVEYLAQ